MITKFKIFEQDSEVVYSKERKLEIEYELREFFDNEEEFDEWCKDQDPDSEDDDNVTSSFNPGGLRDLGTAASYDIPNLLDLPIYDPETTKVIIDLLTNIDFNEPKFDTFEDFKIAKLAKKYNL